MGEREIKAFALAPLPILVPLLLGTGFKAVIGDRGDANAADILLIMSVLILFGYGAALSVGLPIHLALRRFHKSALVYYLIGAALPFVVLAGAIAVWLPLAPAPAPSVNPHGLYMQGGVVIKFLLAFAAVASLSATTFWYAGVRQPKI
ncbi:hypothetical protein [Sphingomonas hengshuiensis]|uniref:Uncharacterized protein n=1 Tax=Sphingomonas hengshuiensis TaxID=1609977 RepID=A0A7U4LE71_9SPHN|nr:hypothetical protein [Sphingomonas hengshuiensis]AJP71045.1 hypothetical protein TS85_03230 [Sphingomonas hengshuiensis]